MATVLSPTSLRAFFDSRPGRYKTVTAWGIQPEADGYLPSRWLDFQLCAPDGSGATKPNPIATQPVIAQPFTVEQLLASISNASAQKVLGNASISKLVDSILLQDRIAVGSMASFHATAGNITSTELAAVQAILSATQPDTTWAAQVPISDLEANFVDALGNAPQRLEMAQSTDGTLMAPNGVVFIRQALGRKVS